MNRLTSSLCVTALTLGGLCTVLPLSAAVVSWNTSLDDIQAGQLTAGTSNPDGDPARPDSSGTGTGFGTYDTTTHVFTWNVTVSGLGSDATVAHFHFGAPGVFRGPVRIETPTLDIGALAGATAGSFSGSQDLDDAFTPGLPAGGLAQLEAEILAGDWYLNIHTRNFAAGEIRGQVTIVPEPPIALLLLCTGAVLLRARRPTTKGHPSSL